MISTSGNLILVEQSPGMLNNDCACPTSTFPILNLPLPDSGLLVHTHQGLRVIPFHDEHSIAFVSSQSHVAVRGHEVHTLLDTYTLLVPLPAAADERREPLALWNCLDLLTDGEPRLPLRPNTQVAWNCVPNACNLRFTYCYVVKSDEATSTAIASTAMDAIIRSACAYSYSGRHLKYASGEDSFQLDRVAQTYCYALAAGSSLGTIVTGVVLSSGTALTCESLHQIYALELGLMISFDGTTGLHNWQRPNVGRSGSAWAALAEVEQALGNGLRLDIAITVTKKSVDSLPELLGWLLDHKLLFSLKLRLPLARAAQGDSPLEKQPLIVGLRAAYTRLVERPLRLSLLGALLYRVRLKAPHDRPYGAGDNYLVIDQQGGMTTWQMELARSLASMPNSDALAVIWLEQVAYPPIDAKEGCCSCDWRYWCARGCPWATYRITGSASLRSPNCELYPGLYLEVLRLEGLRLLHHSRQAIALWPMSVECQPNILQNQHVIFSLAWKDRVTTGYNYLN